MNNNKKLKKDKVSLIYIYEARTNVCVRVCVCVCVCMCACVCAYMYVCAHMYECVHMYVCAYIGNGGGGDDK